jgi:TonB-linked SusC/RagA family outer membrane protein
MQMRRLLLVCLALLFGILNAVAQDRTITGRVTDQNNEGLPGVTVLVKGTTVGTSTGGDGSFSLSAPASATTVVFSFIGYATVERPISDNMTVSLATDTKQLGEVVVTAFGIEREAKSLTYAAQQVTGTQVSQAGQPNVTNALQGKVAGVIVRQSSGMPGSSSQITIRGSRNLTGNNQPLYVIDGLPIESNPSFTTGLSSGTGPDVNSVSGTDNSSRALDINPNDIESITTLKGGSATALYGLRAANGVVVITTKKGRNAGKPTVSFSQDYTMDKVSVLPDLQSTYAQGSGGVFNPNTSLSWGPRLSELDPTVLDKGGKPLVPGKAYDNVEPFFRTGHTSNTALDISNSGEFGNYAAGFGYTNQLGIIPTTGMKRYTAKIAGEFKLNQKLRLSTSANYTELDIDKVPGGSNLSNPLFTTYYAPRSYDMWGIPFEAAGDPQQQINYRAAIDNPRWSLKHNKFNERTNRLFGNVNANYKPTEWMTVNYRLGIDNFTTSGREFYDLGSGFTGGRTVPATGGQVQNYTAYQNQINSNLTVSFDKNVTEDINVNFLVGNEVYNVYQRRLIQTGLGVNVAGLQNIDNTSAQFTSENIRNQRVGGLYANLNTSWKDMIFLNASARADRASNLPRDNRTFFYPSVGLGFVLTEAVKINPSILSFGKLRASYAEVGQQPSDPYVTRNVFVSGGSGSGYLSDGITFPFNGLVGLSQSSTLYSTALSPVNTQTFEYGADLRFWNSRITLDYTFFKQTAEDQIFQVPAAPSTGVSSRLTNAGKLETKGHEVVLGISPIRNESVDWTITANLTSYRNNVIELAPGVDNIYLGGFEVPNVRAQVGNAYPVIFGSRYKRNPEGKIVVDADGYPMVDDALGVIGNVQPDFELGITNAVTYKGLTFSAQVDIRRGGEMYAGNTRLAKLYGIDKVTEDRESDFVFDGVVENVDAQGNVTGYSQNTTVIKRDQDYWYNVLDLIDESNVYKTDFIRLREIVIGYQLPQALMDRTKIFRSASVFVTGRNLLLITDYPNFDPETSVGGGGNFQGLEYVSLPQTRSFGAGLRVTF